MSGLVFLEYYLYYLPFFPFFFGYEANSMQIVSGMFNGSFRKVWGRKALLLFFCFLIWCHKIIIDLMIMDFGGAFYQFDIVESVISAMVEEVHCLAWMGHCFVRSYFGLFKSFLFTFFVCVSISSQAVLNQKYIWQSVSLPCY